MEITVREIAAIVGGAIEGNPEVKIDRPSKIEEGGQGSISFFGNPKYESYVYTTDASALLIPQHFHPKDELQPVLIRVPDVYAAIATLMEKFGEAMQADASGISDRASIASSVELGEQVNIGDFTVISNDAQIGDDCRIEAQVFIGKNVSLGKGVVLGPGVRIHHDCVIGDYCVIHANTVIGSDGFGFAPQQDGSYRKIPQLGNVILENHVELGANVTIDRASMGSTIIRTGVKLDNLVHVAHNVEIGAHTVIAAQTGVAGSTKIGKNCQIGGQVGFAGHLRIADGTRIQAQSGLASHVKEPGQALFGYPAFAYGDFMRSHAVFKKLPEVYKELRELRRQLRALEKEGN